MAYKALTANGLPFELIRSDDIKNGQLKKYKMLFVPGGWASNKLKTLEDKGVREIKRFVKSGGNYLGFCGGAGLATIDGTGLLKVKRKPTKLRVPSFSGRIRLSLSASPFWRGISKPVFHAWWPSQFMVEDPPIKILAAYKKALPDSFSSDLNVGDTEKHGNWKELEDSYGINLNPERMLNDPAVIEGSYGKGKVMLSLIHFDTPDDADGAVVLKNLWKYLAPNAECRYDSQPSGMRNETHAINAPFYPPLKLRGGRGSYESGEIRIPNPDFDSQDAELIRELETAVNELISLGIRNFLWFWRNPLLLQWRRGVRGLEYCTLYAMIKESAEILKKQHWSTGNQDLKRIKELLMPFIEKAGRLLILEKQEMHNRHINYEKCDNPVIQKIRTELFSNSKSHGGLFKTLIDEVDTLLYFLLQSTH